jgi:type VI secretion system protein ImpH
MANALGTTTTAIKSRLLGKGSNFTFFQAYRLLRNQALLEGLDERAIKVRPQLSLSFPENDIQGITENESGYQITANFLGLYGVLSPLPTFYTEDLLDEQSSGNKAGREFLDVLNQGIYSMFFKAWLKTKPHLSLIEFDNKRTLEIFYSLVGFSHPEKYAKQPGIDTLLRFAGIFQQSPKSALGLQTILSGVYPEIEVKIVQLALRTLKIPEDQQCHLGLQAHALGFNTHLGQQIQTHTNNIKIEFNEVSEALFDQLQMGGHEHARVLFLVRSYLIDPLNIELVLRLKKGVAQKVKLGSKYWSSLGRDTWLCSQPPEQCAHLQMSL